MTEADVGTRLRHIGRGLHSRLQGFFEQPLGTDATPLELLHAALDEVERRIQPAGRGRQIFPYNRIVVRVAQPDADPVAIDAVFAGFVTRLQDRLGELKCEAPATIQASVTLVDPAGEPMPLLSVECLSDREPEMQPAPAAADGYPQVTLTVMKGQCAETEYAFAEPMITIGRTAEPTDALGQVRYNHVAFLDERDGVTETVGRAHARLQFDEASRRYYLFNEGSSNPTSIIRAGRMVRVAPRDPRGVRVQSGDQLQLGRAVLRVRIHEG